MMTADFWDNFHLSPFLLVGNEHPRWLRYIGIEGIEWQEGETKVCGYCGAEYTGPTCSGCGNTAPGKHNLGRAVTTLYGPMPEAASIFYLPTGATVDILNRRRGPPDRYIENEVVLRLAGCKVVGRKMPNLTCVFGGTEDLIFLYVLVECEVELYPNGLKG